MKTNRRQQLFILAGDKTILYSLVFSDLKDRLFNCLPVSVAKWEGSKEANLHGRHQALHSWRSVMEGKASFAIIQLAQRAQFALLTARLIFAQQGQMLRLLLICRLYSLTYLDLVILKHLYPLDSKVCSGPLAFIVTGRILQFHAKSRY